MVPAKITASVKSDMGQNRMTSLLRRGERQIAPTELGLTSLMLVQGGRDHQHPKARLGEAADG